MSRYNGYFSDPYHHRVTLKCLKFNVVGMVCEYRFVSHDTSPLPSQVMNVTFKAKICYQLTSLLELWKSCKFRRPYFP